MEKIFIGIDNQRIELTGQELVDFVEDQRKRKESIETQLIEIENRRIAAVAKLQALGLDEDDLKALGL